jgi:hypothetical protein
MNKRIFLFLCVMGFSFNLFAQEETDLSFSLGASLLYFSGEGDAGTSLELGFLLFKNDRLNIRNHISFNAASATARENAGDTEKDSIVSMSERVSVGAFNRLNSAAAELLTYGFVEGGMGFYETKMFNASAAAYNLGIGAGVEAFFPHLKKTAVFIEGGVGERMADTQWSIAQYMKMGVKAYL